MKRKIQLLCSLLVCSLLPAGAQSLFEKHARMLTLPEGYVCYRTAEKIQIDAGRMKPPGSWLSPPLLSGISVGKVSQAQI